MHLFSLLGFRIMFLHVRLNFENKVKFQCASASGYRSGMGSKNAFWNNVFEKKFPKYKSWLDETFTWQLGKTININITLGHIFKHLYNCSISITYVINLKTILTWGTLIVDEA